MTTATKPTRLRNPRTVFLLPAVPDAAQINAGGHVQIRLGTGYTSVEVDLWHLSKEDRTAVKEAFGTAPTVPSLSGSSRDYVALVIEANPLIVRLTLAGIVVAQIVVDPTAGLDPLPAQPGPGGWSAPETEDEDDNEDDNEDEDED